MSSYTCISCRVVFSDGDIQRAHYKTDWHRYNLKRKVADMPPVTAENFQERVMAQRAAVEVQSQGTSSQCSTCAKRFSTANAFDNHIKSRRHQDAEKKASQAAQKEVERLNEKNLEKGLDHDTMNAAIQQAIWAQQTGSPQSKPAQASGAASQSQLSSQEKKRQDKPPRLQWFEEQAKKLGKEHIEGEEEAAMEEVPEEEEAWEDLEEDEEMEEESEQGETTPSEDTPPGVIAVTDCLFCSHHSRSLIKNLAHMTKVHSFFIPDIEFLVDLRALLKYLGEKVGVGNVCLWCNEKGRSFYSAEAVQAHMTDKSHCKLFTDGDAALEFADFFDFRSSYPDQKEGGDVEMQDEELPDENNLEYDDETLELILPSGAKIGHRSLMRYYKQRFGVSRVVAVAGNRNAVGRVLRQYKALGWSSDMAKDASLSRQRDMQYVQRMKSKWMLKTGMSNNSTKQMHFRAQVRF
ncbi:cytoplasmic 60S subunit biogenesis factor ZNF622-like [Acipenser ruthenus]|uniref:cytoplasmic 60S subunit biogenesis factor ZNF622-like n=1 Tax=Acipenser ruthenus TaxID=7906 RepID=UPI002742626E|nr:cytoplasmic 60S subunit biogenesis factor ZNF622-like [Acipenser ruthenus]XP_033914658.3 cytoplasmic 60S subunit biogenesis factor ZNF622-like [Acipenser ruthenus]